jgi:hypothetical protein
MCDQLQKNNIDIKQYHPSLQLMWKQQISVYSCSQNEDPNQKQYESFIDWDDPYQNIRFWKIIDFLRDFKLTK